MGKNGQKIGFVFSTKDRLQYTLRSIASFDNENIDLIWLDGSQDFAARQLPFEHKFKQVRLVEIHENIVGGPDAAIQFGLKRLLDLGYDYCGLIENDVEFKPGWLKKLTELFCLGAADGMKVGATTVRNYESRVMEYRGKYTINWNIGAGMVLFTREAVQQILAEYYPRTAQQLRVFFAQERLIDLSNIWELWQGQWDRPLGVDWSFAMVLLKKQLFSLGSVPSLAIDLDFNPEKLLKTSYVSEKLPQPSAIAIKNKYHFYWIKIISSILCIIGIIRGILKRWKKLIKNRFIKK